jgi:hypothetical protein
MPVLTYPACSCCNCRPCQDLDSELFVDGICNKKRRGQVRRIAKSSTCVGYSGWSSAQYRTDTQTEARTLSHTFLAKQPSELTHCDHVTRNNRGFHFMVLACSLICLVVHWYQLSNHSSVEWAIQDLCTQLRTKVHEHQRQHQVSQSVSQFAQPSSAQLSPVAQSASQSVSPI